jgi:hypothetical protein
MQLRVAMIVDPTVHHEKGTSKSPAVWRVKEEVGSVGHPATLHSKEAVKNFSDQHRKCGQKNTCHTNILV